MNRIDFSRNNHQKIRNATEGIQISVVRQSDDEKGKKGLIVWRYLFRRDDDSPLD